VNHDYGQGGAAVRPGKIAHIGHGGSQSSMALGLQSGKSPLSLRSKTRMHEPCSGLLIRSVQAAEQFAIDKFATVLPKWRSFKPSSKLSSLVPTAMP